MDHRLSERALSLFPSYVNGTENAEQIQVRLDGLRREMTGKTPYKNLVQYAGEPRLPDSPYIDRIAPRLTRARFLDIGCALGENVRYALSKGAREATGVTIDPQELEWGKRLYGDNNAHCRYGNALNLDLPDDSFDIVLARSVIHTLDNEIDAIGLIEEAERVLVPGGAFVGQTHSGTRTDAGMLLTSEKDLHTYMTIIAKFSKVETKIPRPDEQDPMMYFYAVR